MSPDRAFLTIEALIAYMVDSTAWRNITFTPADISGGSPVTVFHQLPAGFFDRHQNVIEIPAEMLGKTVTITFEAAKIGRAHVELQSLMRISYAVFCLKNKNKI